MTAVAARLMDQHHRVRAVQIEADRGLLWLRDGPRAAVPLQVVDIDHHAPGSAYVVHLADGEICEVDDVVGLETVLAEAGQTEKLKQRHIGIWPSAALVLLLIAAMLTGAYQWFGPSFYDALSARIPNNWANRSSELALAELDRNWLRPSNLPTQKQTAISRAFATLKAPQAGSPPYRLLFREGGKVGARTLSLPSGVVVITDELITLAGNDDEVLAALAHELGHLYHRHALRSAVRSAPWSTAWAAYIEDRSAGAQAVAAGLLHARFPLEFEYAADFYAAQMMRANNMSPSLLASLILRQEATETDSTLPGQLDATPNAAHRISQLALHTP